MTQVVLTEEHNAVHHPAGGLGNLPGRVRRLGRREEDDLCAVVGERRIDKSTITRNTASGPRLRRIRGTDEKKARKRPIEPVIPGKVFIAPGFFQYLKPIRS